MGLSFLLGSTRRPPGDLKKVGVGQKKVGVGQKKEGVELSAIFVAGEAPYNFFSKKSRASFSCPTLFTGGVGGPHKIKISVFSKSCKSIGGYSRNLHEYKCKKN